MDCSPPGFSVHGILQARILGWVNMSSSRGSFPPRDRTQVSHVAGRFFTIWAIPFSSFPIPPYPDLSLKAFTLNSRLSLFTFCLLHWTIYLLSVCSYFTGVTLDSLAGSILLVHCQVPLYVEFSRQEHKWVAIPFSRGSSWPRDGTWVSCITRRLPPEPQGKPNTLLNNLISNIWNNDALFNKALGKAGYTSEIDPSLYFLQSWIFSLVWNLKLWTKYLFEYSKGQANWNYFHQIGCPIYCLLIWQNLMTVLSSV